MATRLKLVTDPATGIAAWYVRRTGALFVQCPYTPVTRDYQFCGNDPEIPTVAIECGVTVTPIPGTSSDSSWSDNSGNSSGTSNNNSNSGSSSGSSSSSSSSSSNSSLSYSHSSKSGSSSNSNSSYSSYSFSLPSNSLSSSSSSSSAGCPAFKTIEGVDYPYVCSGGDMTTGVVTSFQHVLANTATISTTCSPWIVFYGTGAPYATEVGEISFGVSRPSVVTVFMEMTNAPPPISPDENYQVGIYFWVNGESVATFHILDYDDPLLPEGHPPEAGRYSTAEINVFGECGAIITCLAIPFAEQGAVPADTVVTITVVSIV